MNVRAASADIARWGTAMDEVRLRRYVSCVAAAGRRNNT